MLTVSAALGRSHKCRGGGVLKIEFFSLIQYFQMEPNHSLSDSSEVLKCFVQALFLNKRQSFFKSNIFFSFNIFLHWTGTCLFRLP